MADGVDGDGGEGDEEEPDEEAVAEEPVELGMPGSEGPTVARAPALLFCVARLCELLQSFGECSVGGRG